MLTKETHDFELKYSYNLKRKIKVCKNKNCEVIEL